MFTADPFIVFRTTLFAALLVYTCLALASTAWRTVVLLRGDDPRRHLLRAYLGYQLVSFRLRPLAGELAQIAFWLAALLTLWWLHRLLPD
jgi:hypothetical protein